MIPPASSIFDGLLVELIVRECDVVVHFDEVSNPNEYDYWFENLLDRNSVFDRIFRSIHNWPIEILWLLNRECRRVAPLPSLINKK